MPRGAAISAPPGRRSSRVRRPGTLALLALAWACALQACAQPASTPAVPSHCAAGERVQFSCRLASKTVSLCAAGSGDTTTLSYRYGRIGQVELAHTADGSAGSRFLASSLPLQPGAQVQQVWFDRADHRYLLAVCVGGMCPQEAVLAVLHAGRVISRQVCPLEPASHAGFKHDVIQFGNNTDDSRADPRLVELADYDNLLDRVFISRRTVPR